MQTSKISIYYAIGHNCTQTLFQSTKSFQAFDCWISFSLLQKHIFQIFYIYDLKNHFWYLGGFTNRLHFDTSATFI